MSTIKIPQGKRIRILKNGQEVLPSGINLTLDSEIQLSLSSQFSPLFGESPNTALTVIGSVTKEIAGWGGSGSFKEMGYQVWQGTKPISFNFTTTLHMTYSGKKEVLDPAKILMKIPLPATQNLTEGFGLLAPGPSILALFDKTKAKTDLYSIRIGMVYIDKVLIERVEPTFSSECDSEGYPTYISLTVECSSLYVATQTMIDNFGPRDIDYDTQQEVTR